MVWPELFRLPSAMPLGWGLIAGGVMIGTGAVINRGCFLGSVSLLGRGDLNYLWTLAGIGLDRFSIMLGRIRMR